VNKLSVVLATRNEESNIANCIESVKAIADEVIVVDESSTDRTREIAQKLGAKVYKFPHEAIFHKSKQKAMDLAEGEWILQLDADERVTPELVKEIKAVIGAPSRQLADKSLKDPYKHRLFERQLRILEKRDGKIGREKAEVTAFFIPRRNFFLGKPLIHAGVYPDASIRLIKKGKGHFPAKSVHEIMQVDGQVGWLENDLDHHDSPTFSRYLSRANRYTDLTSEEFLKSKTPASSPTLIFYSFIKPAFVFFKLYLRHLGFLDGIRGFIWSLFSALHFPIAYFKYWQKVKK
jgi:glycosyltransferase involved in cell wall biosynthesis